MENAGDAIPIGNGERLYRRIPVSRCYYNPEISPLLSPEAFGPDKSRDVTGISLDRASFRSPEEAAQGPSVQGYYLAVLNIEDLWKHGIEVVPKPVPGNPGHVEIPALNSANRKETATQELKKLLAHKLVAEILGPFLPPATPKG